MSKKDPKIIRIGDKVKIVNPEMFVRCGYPMTKQDAREEVYSRFQPQVDQLIKSTLYFCSELKSHFDYDGLAYHAVMEALAYGWLRRKNFGGNNREIYTAHDELAKDQIGIVTKIRFVKTGVYINGYQTGEGEFTPSYLSDERTHKILHLKTFYRNYVDYQQIEAKNVEKIYENQLF